MKSIVLVLLLILIATVPAFAAARAMDHFGAHRYSEAMAKTVWMLSMGVLGELAIARKLFPQADRSRIVGYLVMASIATVIWPSV